MKKRLVRISILKAGVVTAALYFGLSLLLVPFFLIAGLAAGAAAHSGSNGGTNPAFAAGFGIGMAIAAPFFYAFAGFIAGLIGAAVYNLIAKITGGLEFEVADVPPAL